MPLCLRRKVLKYSHDIKASGHLGMKKTLSKIRQGYYCPGLQNDVPSYKICQKEISQSNYNGANPSRPKWISDGKNRCRYTWEIATELN